MVRLVSQKCHTIDYNLEYLTDMGECSGQYHIIMEFVSFLKECRFLVSRIPWIHVMVKYKASGARLPRLNSSSATCDLRLIT